MKFQDRTLNLLLIFLLITAALSGYGLFFPEKFAQYVQRQPAIGKLIALENNVKKKYQSLFTWQSATLDDALYPGDQIYTAAHSSATISLGGSVRAYLEENSLFFLDFQQSQPTINVTKGKIYLEVLADHPPMRIKINNQTLALKGKNARLKITRSVSQQHDLQITLEKGDASVETNNLILQKTFALSPNPSPTPSPTTTMKDPPWEINLQHPQDSQVITLDHPGQLIEFHWQVEQRPENGGQLQLIIAQDESFQQGVESFEVQEPPFIWRALRPGHYFWKILYPASMGQTLIQHFELQRSSPLPMPILKKIPPAHLEIKKKTIRTAPTSAFIQKLMNVILADCWAQITDGTKEEEVAIISWESNPQQKYFIEIYQDRERKKLIQQAEVTTNSYEWPGPRPGKYYWRLAFVDAWGMKGQFTPLMKLTIGQKLEAISENIPPDTITLLDIGADNVINLTSDKEIQFSWQATDGLTTFQFQLAQDLTFQQLIVDQQTNAKSLEIKTAVFTTPGEFFWRVIGQRNRSPIVAAGKKLLASLPLPTTSVPGPTPMPTLAPRASMAKKIIRPAQEMYYSWQIHQLIWQRKSTDEDILLVGTTITAGNISSIFSSGDERWGINVGWKSGHVDKHLDYRDNTIHLLWHLTWPYWTVAIGPSGHFQSSYHLTEEGNFEEKSQLLGAINFTLMKKYSFRRHWHFLLAGALEMGSKDFQELAVQLDCNYRGGPAGFYKWSPRWSMGYSWSQSLSSILVRDFFFGIGLQQFF